MYVKFIVNVESVTVQKRVNLVYFEKKVNAVEGSFSCKKIGFDTAENEPCVVCATTT